MNKVVIICGDCSEKELTREIIRVCRGNGGVLVFDGEKVYCTEKEPYFTVLSVCSVTDIYVPDSIIVLGSELPELKNNMQLENSVCILDGENTSSAAFAAKLGAVSIGCSMSGHDSLTISSFNEDNTAIVTLQRQIRTEDRIIEPCEFKITGRMENSIYPTLAAAAVLLISGKTIN